MCSAWSLTSHTRLTSKEAQPHLSFKAPPPPLGAAHSRFPLDEPELRLDQWDGARDTMLRWFYRIHLLVSDWRMRVQVGAAAYLQCLSVSHADSPESGTAPRFPAVPHKRRKDHNSHKPQREQQTGASAPLLGPGGLPSLVSSLSSSETCVMGRRYEVTTQRA